MLDGQIPQTLLPLSIVISTREEQANEGGGDGAQARKIGVIPCQRAVIWTTPPPTGYCHCVAGGEKR